MDKSFENNFDQFIKDSLHDVEVPYDPSSWVSMEEKLRTAEATALKNVDSVTKGALHNLRVPYESSTWALLSSRLDQIDYNRKLIGLKVIEAAVFILAVLTLVRFLGQFPDSSDVVPQTPFAGHIESIDDQTRGLSEVEVTQQVSPGKMEFTDISDSQKAGIVFNSTHGVDLGSIQSVVRHVVDDHARIVEKSWASSNVAIQPLQVLKFAFVNHAPYAIRNHHQGVLEFVDFRDADMIDNMRREVEGLETEGMVAWYAMNTKRLRTKIGVYSGMNMHDIRSSTPIANFGNIQSQTVVNPAFGIMTNVQFGKFGFDFGLGYEEVRYYSVLDFNEVHKVHIPFHLRFTPVDTRLFNLYAKAGVAVHGAMYAQYQDPPLSAAPGFAARNVERFNDGLLKGGTVESNVYTTRSVGIGIESPVSKDFSIFGEGLHQSHLSGVLSSTTADKFKTISVRFGLNYTFR
ncbi:MAG: hypothetical protein OEQ53_01660 [Saprospiraceae bacterium]|nr:hypothetical protein [Saprospiraceae bacterium]